MSKIKLTYGVMLSIIALIIYGLLVFLGLRFEYLGDSSSVLTNTLYYSGALLFVVVGLVYFKSIERRFKLFLFLEAIFLILFLAVVYFSFTSINHYISLIGQSDSLRKTAITNIDETKVMFDTYEKYASDRITQYKKNLKSVVTSKYTMPNAYSSYGFVSNTDDAIQIENKVFILENKLIPSNYDGSDGIKQRAFNWLDKQKERANNKMGFSIGIIEVAKDLPEKAEEWYKYLGNASKFRGYGEQANDFEYSSFANDSLDTILQKEQKVKPLAILIVIVLSFLLLLPYLVKERNSRWPGINIILGLDGKKANEL